MQYKKLLLFTLVLAYFTIALEKITYYKILEKPLHRNPVSILPITSPKPVTSPIMKSSPNPTSKPLVFSEMNKLYGPCVYLPVIFYHHIQDLDVAKAQGHKGLAVDPKIFASQMQYLKIRGYNTVTPSDLNAFFDSGVSIPGKPIMISFDDGYDDFEINAMPVIRSLNLHVIMFLPTGLVNNSGYLTWDEVTNEAGSRLVYFANHSWSHKSLALLAATTNTEVDTSQLQLIQHSLNPDMALAYPYGSVANFTVPLLSQKGFKLAFTTAPGTTLCKKQRLVLPRVRVGNQPLASLGL